MERDLTFRGGVVIWLFFLVAVCSVPCLAQTSDWERAVAAAQNAASRGDKGEAEKQWKAAIEAAKQLGEKDPRLAQTYFQAGDFYWSQKNFRQTEAHFLLGLKTTEKSAAPESMELADALDRVGDLYWKWNNRDGRTIYVSSSPTSMSAAPRGPSLATQAAVGLPKKAEPYVRRAMAIREKLLEPDSMTLAKYRSEIAEYMLIIEKQGEYLALKELALLAMEKSYTYGGTRQLAKEFADLAQKYMSPFNREGSKLKTFNPEKAEMHYRRALSIYERLYGADSVEAALVLVTIATDIYRSQKKFSEANDLFLRALPAYEKRVGSQQGDIELAKILWKYADVLEDLHLKAEAKKTTSRAKALQDKYSR